MYVGKTFVKIDSISNCVECVLEFSVAVDDFSGNGSVTVRVSLIGFRMNIVLQQCVGSLTIQVNECLNGGF